jgi:hypothetical protein
VAAAEYPACTCPRPQEILQKLTEERYPIYKEAHITIESGIGPHDKVVNDIIWKLNKYLAYEKKKYHKRMARQKAQMNKPENKTQDNDDTKNKS